MLFDIITYLPMFITLFWAIILISTRGKEGKSKIVLGIFMSVSFLLYLSHAVYFHKIESTYIFFDPIYTFATLAVYPIYYWYIKKLTSNDSYEFNNLNLLLPALTLSILSAITYSLMDSGERSHFAHQYLFDNGNIDLPSTLIKIQTYIHIATRVCFYIITIFVFFCSKKVIRAHNERLANYFSNINSQTIHWVNLTLTIMLSISIASLTLNTLGRTFFLESKYTLAIPSFIFSLIYFFIGYLGYKHKNNVENLHLSDLTQAKHKVIADRNSDKLLSNLISQFKNHKVYHDHELKITDLAALLNTNRTYISTLINQEFACSFNEYVNRYRIQEAKDLISKYPEMSLEKIALRVGYGSLSTFFRTFKIQEGKTPNHYKQEVLSKENSMVKKQEA